MLSWERPGCGKVGKETTGCGIEAVTGVLVREEAQWTRIRADQGGK